LRKNCGNRKAYRVGKKTNEYFNSKMAKTTVKPGNPNPSGMPSTTGNKSGGGRSNNPPKQTPSPKLQGGKSKK